MHQQANPLPDDKWKHIYEIDSYEAYLAAISNRIFIVPSAHPDIQGAFRLIQRLIDLAYYEYEFFDLATARTFWAFELALSKRYGELNPGAIHPTTLQKYIKWFHDRGYFETDSMDFLNHVREVRNIFTHPKAYGFAGPTLSHHLFQIAFLVNDLYEDPTLRQHRKDELKNLNLAIQRHIINGAMLKLPNQVTHLVYLFESCFIDNKSRDKQYHFAFKSIFELPEHFSATEPIQTQPGYQLICQSVDWNNNSLIGYSADRSESFRLSPPDAEHLTYLTSWLERYRRYINVVPLFPYIDRDSVRSMYTSALQQFHRQNIQ